jgi:hypothetical protein
VAEYTAAIAHVKVERTHGLRLLSRRVVGRTSRREGGAPHQAAGNDQQQHLTEAVPQRRRMLGRSALHAEHSTFIRRPRAALARSIAVLSLALWSCIVFAGRWITAA